MIDGIHVVFNEHMLPGYMAMVLPEGGGRERLVCRHVSELLLLMSGATWHTHGHCPTWDGATECRCMLGGEA